MEKFKLKRAPRETEDELLGPPLDIDPLTERRCRRCNKRLPASRFFKHVKCTHVISFYDIEEVYADRRFA